MATKKKTPVVDLAAFKAQKQSRSVKRSETPHAGLFADLFAAASGLRGSINLELIIREVERRAIKAALEACNGDVASASFWLGYHKRNSLYFVMQRHPEFREQATRTK